MRTAAVACALLVVLAGCSLPAVGPTDEGDDRLGYEAGYGATDDVPVTTADGLNASERDAVLARTMARVEEIRGLEFEESVELELVSREEYRSGGGTSTPSPADRAFSNARWEALFAVGEDEDAAEAYDAVFESAVVGFYADGRIVVVGDGEAPRLDTRTLAHELLHALQDQHLTFGPDRHTFDGSRAREGLVEGDAGHVESLYEERCGSEWSCLPVPERPSASGSFDRAVYQTVVQPYVDGPTLVERLRERGGWAAVNDAYERFPESTEQTVHPERYPDEPVVDVDVPDRSAEPWRRLDREHPTDRLGEVGVYTMFRANGVVDGPRYSYSHPVSTGWAGDALVPYRNAETNETGYVWRLEWDSEGDAREFHDAYRDLLASKGAAVEGEAVVIPSGPYADAFRVTREGTTVAVVNAPTRDDLDAVHDPE